MSDRFLPLGVDLGSTKVRIAQRVKSGATIELENLVTRDVPPGVITPAEISEPAYMSAIIEDAVREIGVRHRRCVAAVGFPESRIRIAMFPPMSAWERPRTARYEMMGHLDYPIGEAIVRVQRLPGDARSCAIGVIRARTLHQRVACLRKAGLNVMRVDDIGCAFRRALPEYDAFLDIGYHRSTLYLRTSSEAFQADTGGTQVTTAIRKDLGIDENVAEKRKRIIGSSGAGDTAQRELVAKISGLIDSARRICEVNRIAALGNSARLPGLLRGIALSSGSEIEFAVSHALKGARYSPDVTQASAPDWTLAAALSV